MHMLCWTSNYGRRVNALRSANTNNIFDGFRYQIAEKGNTQKKQNSLQFIRKIKPQHSEEP